jgi:deazaflavin-dependent oxidoreductase (nitroreductase family)
MRHAIGVAIVSLFAMVFLHGGWLIRLLNPLFIRYLRAGLPAGPNVLLTVRGRTSGRPRGTPVAMLRLADRRFVQAAYGEVGWVRNLRVVGRADVTQGRHTDTFDAAELLPEVAAALVREALAPYRPSPLLRRIVGPAARPPVGVLHYFGVRIDTTLDEYVADAARHPLFELRAPSAAQHATKDLTSRA